MECKEGGGRRWWQGGRRKREGNVVRKSGRKVFTEFSTLVSYIPSHGNTSLQLPTLNAKGEGEKATCEDLESENSKKEIFH